ncbi:MAG: methyltransferase domain-containing protein [Methylophilaceae bacterium]|nr:methyltransferase domain-containing protein [Methylophilaceae bacterium]
MTITTLCAAKRIVKATLTNQLARFAPAWYVRFTGETGRGLDEETSAQAARYFQRCFDDYFAKLGVAPSAISAFLAGKHILEYGPGDLPGVALLMIAHGAESVVCVDRFPLVQLSEKNLAVIQELLASLGKEAQQRAQNCMLEVNSPAAGFNPEFIRYHIDPNGLSGLRDQIDLVLSRAVLEHVNDLPATFNDMYVAMKRDAIAIHQVDLKSHGLHLSNPLDFLYWSESLWQLMYSHKGVPNRLRVNAYRAILAQTGFDIVTLEPTLLADTSDVSLVRPKIAESFRHISDQDLRWLGFWLVCRKKEN